MKNWKSCALLLAVLFAPHSAFGQQLPDMPKPTNEHLWLQQFNGDWTLVSKATMVPGQPPMDCASKMSSRSLGGFWIINELHGEMSGAPMSSVQTIGYEAATNRYVGTWVDSMTEFMWKYEGTVDASGKILTLDAEGPNFMGDGTLTKFQDIYEFISPDEIRMTSRMLGADKKWVTFMSGTAKRAKEPRLRKAGTP